MIDLPYTEPNLDPTHEPLMLENLAGYFPQVTAAPTWTPRTFRDQFAVYANGSTYRFYIYDTANSAWRYMTLT